MRRADRRTPDDDNARNNPMSRRREPVSYHELQQFLMNARADRDELKQRVVHIQQESEAFQLKASEWEERAIQNNELYLKEKQNYQQAICLYNEEKIKTNEWFTKYEEAATQREQYLTLYNNEQQNYQQALCLYNEEKAKANEWFTKYEEANAQREQYLALYNDAQAQLRYERRSKAGIKGWETRRKRDNDRLKQEIAEMTVLLRESLARKDEAVNNLYVLAERMDRIQNLVDSVEESTNTPISLLQKLKRIWVAIKDILDE
jgi:chromosome segregation ATPase